MIISFTGEEPFHRRLLRFAAYDYLIRNECRKLPVNFMDTLKRDNTKIALSTYMRLSKRTRVELNTIKTVLGPFGAIYYETHNKTYNIFLNREKYTPHLHIHYVLALASAYIEMGLVEDNYYTELSDENNAIYEYISQLLAPNIILNNCDIDSYEDILKLGMPRHMAEMKVHELKKERFKPLFKKPSVLEQLLKAEFSNFIDLVNPKNK